MFSCDLLSSTSDFYVCNYIVINIIMFIPVAISGLHGVRHNLPNNILMRSNRNKIRVRKSYFKYEFIIQKYNYHLPAIYFGEIMRRYALSCYTLPTKWLILKFNRLRPTENELCYNHSKRCYPINYY